VGSSSLVFCVAFCRPYHSLSCFFWPLNCLSLNVRVPITPFDIFKLFLTHQDKFNIFKSGLSLLDPNNTLVDVEILFHNVPCYINIVLQWHTDILIRGESLVCVCVLSVFV
jgi:hypothetical protein